MHHVRMMVLLLSLLLAPTSVFADDYFPPPDSQSGWRTATTPDEIRNLGGMDAAQLDPRTTLPSAAPRTARSWLCATGILSWRNTSVGPTEMPTRTWPQPARLTRRSHAASCSTSSTTRSQMDSTPRSSPKNTSVKRSRWMTLGGPTSRSANFSACLRV